MEPFKNLLGIEAARKIARGIARAQPGFDTRKFLGGLELELEPLELKARMHALKDRLGAHLPEDPERSFPILVGALKQDEADKLGLEGFLTWPLTQLVAEKGLGHFELSMRTLHAMTQVFTAEFAVRPFFRHDERSTLRQFERWVSDPSEHVRRLVSEGSRPLLPWGERLPSFVQDPTKTWKLLDQLRDDPAEYVRKSVANHLNDHSKNHGDWVVDRLSTWKTASPNSPGTLWIIRHATRTLVKKGHPGALALHGVGSGRVTIVSQKILTPRVRLGGKLRTLLRLWNEERKETKVIVDHELGFLKANGKHAPKVFKGKTLTLAAGETRDLELEVPLKKITTRVYYPGTQLWLPLVNGKKGRAVPFVLT